jgi:hypothetical protein
VSDRLYLSCWLRDTAADNVLAQFGRMLELFPFSKLAKRGPHLRVYAIDLTEPPAAEHEFLPGAEPAAILEIAREAAHDDSAVLLETFWDLWQLEEDWQLTPASVTLCCFGPAFDNDSSDQVRIDFGLDAKFLPSKGDGARMAQDNVRSLLRLARDVDVALELSKQQLWSESGESFAEVLKNAIHSLEVH